MYKVTVIICVFNEEASIMQALRSLYQNKLYPETEIIIVDDCSTNKYTIRLLTLLEKYSRVLIIKSIENKGLSNSRNLGFLSANTNYILPLDADDIFPPGAIDDIYQTFLCNHNADFIVGNYLLRDIDSEETKLVDCSTIATASKIDITKLATEWKLLGTSPCKKTVWQKVQGYDLKYSYSVQDVDFWIRVLLDKHQGVYLDKPIYVWNKSATGMNTNFDRMAMVKLLEDHPEFYLLNFTKKYLYNKIFEAYYPYKQGSLILSIGKKYFFYLKSINKVRFFFILITNLFD
jgi:glycosyltransferase involved in cell wall biosynthesis